MGMVWPVSSGKWEVSEVFYHYSNRHLRVMNMNSVKYLNNYALRMFYLSLFQDFMVHLSGVIFYF